MTRVIRTMQVWDGPDDVPAQLRDATGLGSVVTIGIFDGVHRGHQAIIDEVVREADRRRDEQGRRPLAVAVTFDPHPSHVHQPETPLQLITSLEDRLEALACTGLDAVLVIHYDLDFADQSPEDFIHTWMASLLDARAIVVGEDVRFGRANSGDAACLRRIGQVEGIDVTIVRDMTDPGGRRWSSTWIRTLLAQGEVRQANLIVGRPHRLRGTVVHGFQRGRLLGFPTANLDAASAGVVPPDGVYAGWLLRETPRGLEYLPAAISVGTNPTFDDVPTRTVEAHVLGRSDLNLYGQEVVIELIDYLRPMIAFDSLEPLLEQMRVDIERTADVLGVPVPGPIRPEDVTAQP